MRAGLRTVGKPCLPKASIGIAGTICALGGGCDDWEAAAGKSGFRVKRPGLARLPLLAVALAASTDPALSDRASRSLKSFRSGSGIAGIIQPSGREKKYSLKFAARGVTSTPIRGERDPIPRVNEGGGMGSLQCDYTIRCTGTRRRCLMGRDKVLGLSLAILLIGFAAAFCFRNDPFVEKGLKLARAKILDDAIAQRPGPKPYAYESKSRHDKSNSPTVTLQGIESADPFADINDPPADGPKSKTNKTDRLAAHVSTQRLLIRPMAEPKMPVIGTLTIATDAKPASSDTDRSSPPASDTASFPPIDTGSQRLSSAEPPADDAAIAAHRGAPPEIIIRPNPPSNRRSFSQSPRNMAWQSAADQPDQGSVADNSTPGGAVSDTPPSGGAVSETPPSGGVRTDNPPSASSAGDSQPSCGSAADNQSSNSPREPQTTDKANTNLRPRSHSFRENAAAGTQPGDITPRDATVRASGAECFNSEWQARDRHCPDRHCPDRHRPNRNSPERNGPDRHDSRRHSPLGHRIGGARRHPAACHLAARRPLPGCDLR